MAVEVALYGVALVWILALVPAAVVTCLRGEWAMFLAGWLTAGLVWFIAAAPRTRRSRRIGLAAITAAVLVLGVLGARPTRFFGVDAGALQASVGASAFFGGPDACEHIGHREWKCGRWDNQASSVLSYRVRVNRFGCWHASHPRDLPAELRQRLSGCVTLVDYVFA